MQNILLKVSYDGTDFCGWQRQDNEDGGEAFRTVQGEIEKALFKTLKSDIKTADIGGSATCTEFTEEIIKNLEKE